jgi:hypothetical protein
VTRKSVSEWVQAWTPKDHEMRTIPLPAQAVKRQHQAANRPGRVLIARPADIIDRVDVHWDSRPFQSLLFNCRPALATPDKPHDSCDEPKQAAQGKRRHRAEAAQDRRHVLQAAQAIL